MRQSLEAAGKVLAPDALPDRPKGLQPERGRSKKYLRPPYDCYLYRCWLVISSRPLVNPLHLLIEAIIDASYKARINMITHSHTSMAAALASMTKNLVMNVTQEDPTFVSYCWFMTRAELMRHLSPTTIFSVARPKLIYNICLANNCRC